MLRASLRLLVVASLLIPATASASWFIGPNFGLTYHSPTEGETSTFVSWGGSSGSVLAASFQPGMRVGWGVGDGRDEIYANTGLELISVAGTSAHIFQGTLNYQHAFSKPKTDGVFASVGAGVFATGGEEDSATLWVLGGAVGFQHFFIDGHARFRGELRYDRMGEDTDMGIPGANVITAQFGFDLMP
jgi:hypothetical protein